jgi:hypothetical protein
MLAKPLTFVHALSDYVELRHGEQPLFRYVYVSKTAPRESPKPYFQPIYTLNGNLVSHFRPHDHLWHTGIAMTSAHLSGHNFWGGPTYVHGQGYVQLPNNGRIVHRAWDELHCDQTQTNLVERLDWITIDEERVLAETREISLGPIDPDRGYWSLDLHFALRNVAGRPLEFGSPTTQGRTLAGYGSLHWRGPRSFTGGKILAGGGLEGPTVMGQAAPWLAFVGRHDGTGDSSTLVFLDQPENPRYPNRWFVRTEPYACVACSFMFDEVLTLPADEELKLHYQVVIADGEWTPERIEELGG